MSQCTERVAVRADAIDWLKKHYPSLCLKSGLCESVAGKLYTRTFLTEPSPLPVGEDQRDAVRLVNALRSIVDNDTYETEYDGRMLVICHSCGLLERDGHSPHCDYAQARAVLTSILGAGWDSPAPPSDGREMCPHCGRRFIGLRSHIKAKHTTTSRPFTPEEHAAWERENGVGEGERG